MFKIVATFVCIYLVTQDSIYETPIFQVRIKFDFSLPKK